MTLWIKDYFEKGGQSQPPVPCITDEMSNTDILNGTDTCVALVQLTLRGAETS